MTICCSCNSSGRCKNCSCVKAGRNCSTCLLSRLGRCANTTVQEPTSLSSSLTPWRGPLPLLPPSPTTADSHTVVASPYSDNASKEARPAAARDDPTTFTWTPSVPELPPFVEMSRQANSTWSDTMSAADFTQAVTAAYAEVVHWCQNLFLTPSEKAGKKFTAELARMYRAYAECTALEPIALKAAMVMPSLLLRKPHASSKACEHADCLHRRLQAWQKGDVNNLVIEGRTIQARLKQNSRNMSCVSEQQTARRFTKLMMQGKVKAALRLISEEGKGALLLLDTQLPTDEHQPEPITVRDELLKKHPPGQPAHPDTILYPDPRAPPVFLPVIFECLDGAAIRSAALHTNGSAGPSGLDAIG